MFADEHGLAALVGHGSEGGFKIEDPPVIRQLTRLGVKRQMQFPERLVTAEGPDPFPHHRFLAGRKVFFGQLPRFPVTFLDQQFANLRQVLVTAGNIVIDPRSRPDRVFVQDDCFLVRAAIYHRPDPAVAEHERLVKAGCRLCEPEGGGRVVRAARGRGHEQHG